MNGQSNRSQTPVHLVPKLTSFPNSPTSFKGDASVYSSRNIARSGCQNANEAIALGASISTAAEFSTICLVDSSVASPLKDVVRLGTRPGEALFRETEFGNYRKLWKTASSRGRSKAFHLTIGSVTERSIRGLQPRQEPLVAGACLQAVREASQADGAGVRPMYLRLLPSF